MAEKIAKMGAFYSISADCGTFWKFVDKLVCSNFVFFVDATYPNMCLESHKRRPCRALAKKKIETKV